MKFQHNPEARMYGCHPDGDDIEHSEFDAIERAYSSMDRDDIVAMGDGDTITVYVYKYTAYRYDEVLDLETVYEWHAGTHCPALGYPEPSARVKMLAEMLAEEMVKQFGLVEKVREYEVNFRQWVLKEYPDDYREWWGIPVKEVTT